MQLKLYKDEFNMIVLFPDKIIYQKEYDHNQKKSFISSIVIVFFKSSVEQEQETLKLINDKIHYNGDVYQTYKVDDEDDDEDDDEYEDDDDDYYDDIEDYDDEGAFYNE